MNPLAAGIEGSLIREIAALRRPDSIDLGLGEPSLLPQMRFFEAATAWVGEHGCKYTVNAGDVHCAKRSPSTMRIPAWIRPRRSA